MEQGKKINIPNDKHSRRLDGRQSENGAAFPKRLPHLRVKKMNLLFQGGYIGDLFRQSAFTSVSSEIFGRNTVGLLKELIEIRYGRKTYIVADGKDRIIGIL